MRNGDPELPKLTKNDQEVLKHIINQAKMPDKDIAKKLRLSPQAVFKIRHKLEERGIIKGYQPVIDVQKLGIKVAALFLVRFTDEVWSDVGEEQLSERLRRFPYVMSAYRVMASDATHALIMGFRDLEQMQRYVAQFQTKYASKVELVGIYPVITNNVITNSSVGLLVEMLDKKEYALSSLFRK